MRRALLLLLFGIWACAEPSKEKRRTAAPSPASQGGGPQVALRAEDVEAYLAVKRKAMSRLEESLERLENQGGDPLQELREMAALEAEAAKALGYDPVHYAQVKEAVAALLAAKSREESAFRVEQELTRSRAELARQREQTKDAAAREFLQAQITALDRELARLAAERGRIAASPDLELLSKFRVDMAQLQARQERLTRRIRQVWAASKHPQANPPSPRP